MVQKLPDCFGVILRVRAYGSRLRALRGGGHTAFGSRLLMCHPPLRVTDCKGYVDVFAVALC